MYSEALAIFDAGGAISSPTPPGDQAVRFTYPGRCDSEKWGGQWMLIAVTGINWGDEGKGRVIDLLAGNADVVVRYQGGNNAGHTVVTDQGKFVLNLLPSGILHPDVTCVLGDGMVVDLDHLAQEIQGIRQKGIDVTPENLKLSARATISMPWHRIQDELEEDRLSQNGAAFGSTRRGIAYAYSDKYRKKTLRLGDLLHLEQASVQARLKTMLEAKNLELGGCYHQEPMSYPALISWCQARAMEFGAYICDTGCYLDQALQNGKCVVLEAPLGAMRDIDYGILYLQLVHNFRLRSHRGRNPRMAVGSCGGRSEGLFHLRGSRPLCCRNCHAGRVDGGTSQSRRRVWGCNRATAPRRAL